LRRFEEQSPEAIVELLPSLLRVMLTAFVEMMADERWGRADGADGLARDRAGTAPRSPHSHDQDCRRAR
jgi:hypothetical protein